MAKNNDQNRNVMTVAHLQELLALIVNESGSDFEVWLSSDEEGNDLLPMPQNEQLGLYVDKEQGRITLFPVHR